ncbi:MAG: bile acid:sodium symporter family protein [Candidatus Omnitrophota bacterium]
MINRVADWFTHKLVLWVLSAVALGYFWPQSLIGFRPYTEWLFAVTMFGIGAVLSSQDFKPVLKSPQSVLLGTAAQFAIMPLAGFLIAKILHLPPELALGIILVGATPGAMASNVISYLAKADVAYSVALTSASTLLSPLLTPLFTYILAHSFIQIRFWPMVASIVKMVILPLLMGMLVKHYFSQKVDKIAKVFPALSSLFIAFICGLVVALNKGYLAGMTTMIFAAVFLHNLAGLILGYEAGRLYRFDTKRCRTLSFEVGMQNAGLGAVLALKHFSVAAAIPNALFATWCVITAAILAEFWRQRG